MKAIEKKRWGHVMYATIASINGEYILVRRVQPPYDSRK